MKAFFLTTLALLSLGMATAQNNNEPTKINTIMVNTTGDVTLTQGSVFRVDGESVSQWSANDSVLNITGKGDCFVTLEEIKHLMINSSGDVFTSGTIHGKDLFVWFNSSGDSRLDLDYDKVCVFMNGKGDLVLNGQCNNLVTEKHGSGDLNTKNFKVLKATTKESRSVPNLSGLSELLAELGANLEHLADSVDWQSFEADMERWGQSMEEWGQRMEEWGERVEREMDDRGREMERWGNGKPDVVPQPDIKVEKKDNNRREPEPKKKSLLFDPHWTGFETGLNILLGPGSSANFEGQYLFLEQRPMKSWLFNFNLADVGIAFNRNHVGGLYTGIGLGWNNYSFNNPVRLYKDNNNQLEGEWIDEQVEGKVKKSKLGVLYVQAPLMIEIRPTRKFHFAAGVVGGVRVDAWTKVKFVDKSKEKYHGDYYVNLFKLDAMLRAGGNDMGFFASYNLLPLFYESNAPTSQTLCFGFSILF